MPTTTNQAAATTTSTNNTKQSADSGINANDFLTLLVTELKNQDPTQPQDPAQYVQQLVGVNSLQQLIGINQGITSLNTAVGVTTTTNS
ncbi:MAG: flagellar hook capping protein [Acidobacteria bacterium]|nr:flagellar hook capping protein [Acidobacteriota bacterium]